MTLATGGLGSPVAFLPTRGIGRKVASAAHRTALATAGIGSPVGLFTTRGLGRKPVAGASVPHRTAFTTGGLGSPVGLLATRGLGRDPEAAPSAPHLTDLVTSGLGSPIALLPTRGLGRNVGAAPSVPHITTLATDGLGSPVALLPTRGLGRTGAVVPEAPVNLYPGGGPERSETYRAPWARRRTALHAGQMYAPAVYRQIEEERRAKRTPEIEKRGERLVLEIDGEEIEIRPSKGPSLGRELRARAKPEVLEAIMAELAVTEEVARKRLRDRIRLERQALNAWRQSLIDDDELLILLLVI